MYTSLFCQIHRHPYMRPLLFILDKFDGSLFPYEQSKVEHINLMKKIILTLQTYINICLSRD